MTNIIFHRTSPKREAAIPAPAFTCRQYTEHFQSGSKRKCGYYQAVMAGQGIIVFGLLANLAPQPGAQTCHDPLGTSDRLAEDHRVWHQVIAKQC
jgi:hypothetical protein